MPQIVEREPALSPSHYPPIRLQLLFAHPAAMWWSSYSLTRDERPFRAGSSAPGVDPYGYRRARGARCARPSVTLSGTLAR